MNEHTSGVNDGCVDPTSALIAPAKGSEGQASAGEIQAGYGEPYSMKQQSDNNPEADLQKRRVPEDFEESLRLLAVNMLRVVAGAGKPYYLLEDIYRCSLATTSYRECHDEFPTSYQIAELMNCMRNLEGLAPFSREEPPLPAAPSDYDVAYASAKVRQASLRIIAAQWDGNRTVLSNAEGMFASAILWLEELRERRRNSYRGSQRG